MKTTDGGNNWFDLYQTNLLLTLNSVYFVNELTGWSVGKYGTIVKTITGGLTDIVFNESQTAGSFFLEQNFPNPFNPFTKIKFIIDKPSDVKLCVYDVNGKLMNSLINTFLQAGSYEISFDGTSLSSGIYLYRLESETRMETRRMILIK